ncbi:MAG: rRNA maturation RNase YbeY, partial [Chthoniobacteraceae bacterium]
HDALARLVSLRPAHGEARHADAAEPILAPHLGGVMAMWGLRTGDELQVSATCIGRPGVSAAGLRRSAFPAPRFPLSIVLQNRQRAVALDVPWLRRLAPLALEKCRDLCADGKFALRSLEEISVAIVSDRTMARLHVDFMGIPGPTDVLTFQHGEIVMSAQTAAFYAAEHGHRVEQELALYTIHGLLHLNGFNDATSHDAARMQKVQTRVLKECLAEIPST